jgi:hypothetical protein
MAYKRCGTNGGNTEKRVRAWFTNHGRACRNVGGALTLEGSVWFDSPQRGGVPSAASAIDVLDAQSVIAAFKTSKPKVYAIVVLCLYSNPVRQTGFIQLNSTPRKVVGDGQR